MADLNHIKSLIESAIPQSQVEIADLGGGDHLSVRVTSPTFAGKMLIEQHQMINNAVKHLMADQTIHALTIKTIVPGK